MYGECAHEQARKELENYNSYTLTLTHTITAYSVSGNVRVRITGQKPCRKRVCVISSVVHW